MRQKDSYTSVGKQGQHQELKNKTERYIQANWVAIWPNSSNNDDLT